uniref:NADH dehydrogenase subunit 6 n=1 Tax=Acentronura tentaculata TaxID=1914712 RepID=UPI00211F2AFC|nr:NADH dehydrogenase subunit 6 [Acentronura tentaculata]UTV00968.1 NADH dehydrogenase subunit 6 [Acentronura tentaculata]
MTYLMSFLLMGLIFGLIGVASNPSPYFAALGLVMMAGMSCGVILSYGGSFLSLVLFLIYLGGMLVVFAYSADLAAEPYPESWGSLWVMFYGGFYFLLVGVTLMFFYEGWFQYSWVPVDELSGLTLFRGDTSGVVTMYASGGVMLVVAACSLLLTLFVVLELTRTFNWGTLRVH